MAWDELASEETIKSTIEALQKRGIDVELLETGEDALERLKQLIPAGSEVLANGTVTMDQIGLINFLKSGNHPWKNLKDNILAEKDQTRQMDLRKKSTTAEYVIGSANAVSQNGDIVFASATGSQLPSYAYSSKNVIWVVGTQKIAPSLDEAVRRVREYVFPLEDKRMKNIGYSGSVIGKWLIIEKESSPHRTRLIFVKEKLGF